MTLVRRLLVAGATAVAGTVIGGVGAIIRRGPDNPVFSELVALDPARLRSIAELCFELFLAGLVMLSFWDFWQRPLPTEPDPPGHAERLDSPEPRT
jgi:hypothetical protein